MDKKDWEQSLQNLKNLLKIKVEKELPQIKKDIEEITYTIACYKQKIEKFK